MSRSLAIEDDRRHASDSAVVPLRVSVRENAAAVWLTVAFAALELLDSLRPATSTPPSAYLLCSVLARAAAELGAALAATFLLADVAVSLRPSAAVSPGRR